MLLNEIKWLMQNHFNEQCKKITELSLDDANDEVLCESDFEAWDFDGIMKEYCSKLGIDIVSSPDLLHFKSNKLVFVEFKNGKYDSKQRKNTRLKLIEGPLVGLKELLDSNGVKFQLNDLYHLNKEFILVLNQEKQNDNPAASFHRGMGRIRNRSILERYEGVFVSKVHILSPQVFLETVVAKWVQDNKVNGEAL